MLAGHWQDLTFESAPGVKTRGIMSAWHVLTQNSQQPAAFNSPELLFPILKHMPHCELASVSQGADLLMVVPLASRRTHRASLASPLLASGLPHLSSRLTDATVQSFLKSQTQPVFFKSIPAESSFFDVLKKHATHLRVMDAWQRAALKPKGSFAEWMSANFDQKRRKEFKRQRTRLSEVGTLTVETQQSGQTAKPFVDDFLRLEASGWKGKKGTAINSQPQLVQALHEATETMHKVGKLRFWTIKLDGKAIASLYAWVEGTHAWLGKIAYDEAYAKYSPGVMIVLECTESFFNDAGITQVDSTAIPDHPMIDRLWRDRLPMVDVCVGSDRISKLRFDLVSGAEKIRIMIRSILRHLYYRLRKEHRS